MKPKEVLDQERMNVEEVVKDRYAKGAEAREEALCCPVNYDPKYLKLIPDEILEKDYGCGDPSQYLKEGDVVLDLGSGGGKICYIASQIVGAKGKVVGVDFNPTMLDLARKYQKEMGEKIGWNNVEFRWGKIQDLKTDLDWLQNNLKVEPIQDLKSYLAFDEAVERAREKTPLVAANTVDVIVSNCVLNLVRSEEKKQLFQEMFRVLKRGGRVAISDIVSDEEVPEHLRNDADLWSGCISGAFEEKAFVKAFEDAGFYGAQIVKRDEKPWKVVEGIEFRSVTITAYKGKEGECLDHNQAVIYKGPWKQVLDDDGHVLNRGARTAVCKKTYDIYTKEPYAEQVIPVDPRVPIAGGDAKEFDCRRNAERHPKETKGMDYKETVDPMSECCDDTSCC